MREMILRCAYQRMKNTCLVTNVVTRQYYRRLLYQPFLARATKHGGKIAREALELQTTN